MTKHLSIRKTTTKIGGSKRKEILDFCRRDDGGRCNGRGDDELWGDRQKVSDSERGNEMTKRKTILGSTV